jgi:hypothetical protein
VVVLSIELQSSVSAKESLVSKDGAFGRACAYEVQSDTRFVLVTRHSHSFLSKCV